MTGSRHFQVYDRNLRRILLLDWLRDEQARRTAAQGIHLTRTPAALAPSSVGRKTARPYWLDITDATIRAAALT